MQSHSTHAQENSEPNTKLIWVLIISLLIFLVVVQLASHFWFLGMKDEEIQSKQVASQPVDLQMQHLTDAEVLGQYKWLDKEKGQVRIPISRAMELLAEEARSKDTAIPNGGLTPSGGL